MKYFVFLVFFTAVYQVESSKFYPYEVVNDLLNGPQIWAITEMGMNQCKNKSAEVKEKIETLKQCYLDIGDKETICTVVKDRLVKCFKPVAEFLETCVKSTKYQDIPQFAVEVVNSVGSYVCQSKGEKLIELFHPCLIAMGYEKEQVCLKSFKQKLSNLRKDNSITNIKFDFCMSLEKTKSCYLKQFKDTCKNDVTLESAVGFYDALITKPCKHV